MRRSLKNYFLYSIAAIIFFIAFYNPFRIQKEINNNQRFSVGTIEKETSSLKNGEDYKYVFYYKKIKYKGYVSKNKNYQVNIEDKFIVEFSYINPENSKLLYDYPVSIFFKNIPVDGWREIPNYDQRVTLPQVNR